MALIKCPECGREISSNAAACPHCGNPVPKKMCPVLIERIRSVGINRPFALLVNCIIYMDGNPCGELKDGDSMNLELPAGTHNISTESHDRNILDAAARQKSAKQFIIEGYTSSVEIGIKTKWGFGGIGRCVLDSVICHR